MGRIAKKHKRIAQRLYVIELIGVNVRVRQPGFDFELWILSLTWLSRPGESCIILPSQGSLVK